MQLVDKINIYNTISNTIASVQQTTSTRRERPSQYADQIFIPEYQLLYMQIRTDDLLDGEKKHLIDSLRNAEPPLQTNNPSLFNSFGNAILATKPKPEQFTYRVIPKSKKISH